MESSDIRHISDDIINKLLTTYTNNKWHSLPVGVPSDPSSAHRSGLPTGLVPVNSERIGKMGRELMYSVSKKYVLLMCKTDFEQKWLHTTAEDPFVPRVGKPGRDRKANKPAKSPKTANPPTFADKVDSVAVLIHNNCVFNWTMFNELLRLIKSDKIRVKSKCIDLMYASFMEVLPLRKLRYVNEQDPGVLEYLWSALESSNWLSGDGSSVSEGSADASQKESDEKASTNGSTKGGSKAGGANVAKGWDLLEFDALALLLAVSFEDFVKGIYSSFIHELADLMNRGVDFLQKNSSNLVLQMLIQKPEQEELLLDLIINRLTHKNNKMSSYVFKMLDTLLLNHRNMKSVVVRKIVSQLESMVGRLESLLSSLVSGSGGADRVGGLLGAGSGSVSSLEGANRANGGGLNGVKANALENGTQRLTRNGMQKCLKISTRKMLNSMCSELVPMLKNIYRFVLYVSKLQYNKSDGELVTLVMNNNVKLLLLFTGPPPKMSNGVSGSSRIPNTYNQSSSSKSLSTTRSIVISGLYKLDECNRIIKVLLSFTNKLLNHYKKVNLYEEKRSMLISAGIDKNLYNLSRETRSSSITILLLLLLHNMDPANDFYVNILYENVFNTKLYEASNILKFLNLVEQILDTNKDFTRTLIRKLLQMGLCNYNNSINCAIIDLIHKYINEGNLWELYLYNSTYNPHLVKSVSNVNARTTRSSSSRALSKLDSLTAFSASGSSGFSSQGLAKSGRNDSGSSDSRSDGATSGGRRAYGFGKLGEDRSDGDISVNVTSRGTSYNQSSGSSNSAKGGGTRGGSATRINNIVTNRAGLYDELSVFSKCSQVDYTLERFWTNNRQPELHQRPFELFYRAKWNMLSSELSYDTSARILNGTDTKWVFGQALKRKLEGVARGVSTRDGGSDKDSRPKFCRLSATAKDVKSAKKTNAAARAATGSSADSRVKLASSAVGGSSNAKRKNRTLATSHAAVETGEDSEGTSDVEIDEPHDDSVSDTSDDSYDSISSDSEGVTDLDDEDSDYVDG